MKTYFDKDNKFFEIFNEKTGLYIRSGIIENGEDTDIDPFMRNFPSLIDVGIMGSCVHGTSGLCLQSGVQCYQNGLNVKRNDMSLEDFKSLADQCADRTFQFALGGRGDANMHYNFEEILQYAHENGIVCNYTTSGLGLMDRQVELTKEYCGACAVSEYYAPYTRKAIRKLVNAGVKTNIHFVLSNYSINDAIFKLKNNQFDEGINAVIFLLHKPIGLGSKENVLSPSDPRVTEFFDVVDGMNFDFKVGFDSCSCSGIVNFTKNILPETIEPCESARHSMYIDSEMNAMPCSFCNQDNSKFIDLHKYTIEEAWNSKVFEDFRDKVRNSCVGCSMKSLCSQCPAVDGISLCKKEFCK